MPVLFDRSAGTGAVRQSTRNTLPHQSLSLRLHQHARPPDATPTTREIALFPATSRVRACIRRAALHDCRNISKPAIKRGQRLGIERRPLLVRRMTKIWSEFRIRPRSAIRIQARSIQRRRDFFKPPGFPNPLAPPVYDSCITPVKSCESLEAWNRLKTCTKPRSSAPLGPAAHYCPAPSAG